MNFNITCLAGENILWRNWDFPIFLINDGNTTQDLFDCYEEFNRYKAGMELGDSTVKYTSLQGFLITLSYSLA